jgi:mannose-6-phosphate isomerase-like protein (cupin superfamily)
MSIPTHVAFNPAGTFVHLDGEGGAATLEGGEAFWTRPAEELDRNYPGRILGALTMASGNSTWEMHPDGGEVLYLLSGAVEVVLQEKDGERAVELSARRAFIVPRGTWHRLAVRMPSEFVFITPGKGTKHRPLGE